MRGKKDSIETFREIAQAKGGECLSTEYKGQKSKLTFRCAKGHVWNASPINVKFNDTWCKICALKARRVGIAKCDEAARQRGGRCISRDYRNSRAPILWECAAGHQFRMPAEIVLYQQSWCPVCSTGIGERITREFFEQLLGTPFPKCRPRWLKTAKVTQMELDGYSKTLGIAFEHQGRQHFGVKVAHFGESEDIRERDEQKRHLCNEHAVILIEVPEVPTMLHFDDLPRYLRAELLRHPISAEIRELLDNFDQIEVDYKKAYQQEPLKELRRIAEEHGGRVVSRYYLGIYERLEFECAKGHRFRTSPSSIIHAKTWCRKCSVERTSKKQLKPVSELHALAAKRNGKFLSTTNKGAHKKHLWECEKGHQFEATPANVLMGKWCKTCYLKRVEDNVQIQHAKHFREFLSQKGGALISEYFGGRQKISIQCEKGHIWKARTDQVLGGNWCPECYRQRLLTPLSKLRDLAAKHDGKLLSTTSQGLTNRHLWECEKGHRFEMTPRNIMLGRWCPQCRQRERSKDSKHQRL